MHALNQMLTQKVHDASMGPTWVLSAPDGPHVGPMNLAIRAIRFIYAWKRGPWSTPVSIVMHVCPESLTHWGRVTHICVIKLTIIGSDNGLSPGRHQAIIWINAGILLIRTLGTNFSEILSEIHTFAFKKIHLKMSSGKRRPFCLGFNVLISIFSMKCTICIIT